jgi:putative hydrolase of the HAD superfamily
MNGIEAVLFDVNGTLVDIRTEENDAVFRAVAHVLAYSGIALGRDEARAAYAALMAEQRAASAEEHPEFDVVAIWARVVEQHATAFTRALPAAKREWLPLHLAETQRAVSRRRLRLYPYVRTVLKALATRFPLAVVTDAQSPWARGELHRVGLDGYFDPVVVSGDHGYRKPDRRLFERALSDLGVAAEHAVYVGNDMHRDVYGARAAGMRTIMFASGQGAQTYRGTRPDHVVHDHRALLPLLGLPALGGGGARSGTCPA